MMINQKEIEQLEAGLDSFNPITRKESLVGLMAFVHDGLIPVPEPKNNANLHCHSFFSFNAYGFSPSHLAWLGRKQGIMFMGIVDFDILDGVDEFLEACRITGVRGTAGIETRVYIPEFRHAEINSPGEPGIAYHMGVGFVRSRIKESVASAFSDIRHQGVQRNLQIVQRINDYLAPFKLDYEKDVLPLTPSGYATERHMVHKIAEKSFEQLEDPLQFWSEKLGQSVEFIENKRKDQNAFNNFLRQKLIKRGGVAYVQPEGNSFPTVDTFHEIIMAEKAIPCLAWLDGTSSGEAEIERLLDLLMEKGVATLNIIPDRNWNINDPEVKAVKVKNLYKIVDLAESLDIPILVGTEMNSFGQKLVDDFEAPELAPVRDRFINGAYFLYGHTLMAKMWGMGYQSEWSQNHLTDRKSKNAFYEAVGRLVPPGVVPEINLDLNSLGSADQILQTIEKGIMA
jgi:hypothetical protein